MLGRTILTALVLALLTIPCMAEDKIGRPLYRSANATQAVDFGGDWIKGFTSYRVAVAVSGSPTGGTLKVLAGGGVGGQAELSETIDLTNPKIFIIDGPVDSLRFAPHGFDGDGYTVEVLAWR
jgi:hypothetical protein